MQQSFALVPFTLTTLVALSARADAPFHVDVGAGPAFATYRPIDDGDVPEHLVATGSQLFLGAGYRWTLGPVRLEAGARLVHLRLPARGSYSMTRQDEMYEANYDFVAPMAHVGITTNASARVNVFAGATMGTAALVADPKGRTRHIEHIPVYGTFEAGVLLELSHELDLLAGVAWTPPVDQTHVFAPHLGLRAGF